MSSPGVNQPTRIIVDDRMARHEFFSTAIYSFDSLLTRNDPARREELINIYLNSVNTALTCIEEDFQTYVNSISSQLDHTQTIFAEEILANPMIATAIDQANHVLSIYIYFKLREFGFISDSNTYVLDMLGSDFYVLTVYPATFSL
jgi:hypothetical protein